MRLALSLFFFLFLLSAAQGGPCPPSPPSTALAFQSAEYGIALEPPKGWDARTGVEGSLVQYLAPKTPLARSTLDVAVTELGEVQELKREDALGIVRHLAGRVEGFDMLGSKEVEVAGVKAWRISYKARYGKHILTTTQVFLARTGRLYLFTLTTAPEQHPAHSKALNRLLASVRWL
ncbi:MAG: hypothetical protein AB1758_32490 [Candidatus Eremiobacterota bacterium]